MKGLTVFSAFLAAILLLATTSPVQAGEAKALWEKKCAICHGDDGKAATKAGQKKNIPSFADDAVKSGFDRARMIESVTNGIPEEGSDKLKKKGFAEKLSAEEIAALVDYVIELAGPAPAAAATDASGEAAPTAGAAAAAEAAAAGASAGEAIGPAGAAAAPGAAAEALGAAGAAVGAAAGAASGAQKKEGCGESCDCAGDSDSDTDSDSDSGSDAAGTPAPDDHDHSH